jgi:hypothetical protein
MPSLSFVVLFPIFVPLCVVLVPSLVNPLPLLLVGVPFCHVPPLLMLVPPMDIDVSHACVEKLCVTIQKKVLQTREALEDTLNNMKSILKKNSKHKCEALMLELFWCQRLRAQV